MFDGAWAEFILLAMIALIFLGPKELISLCRAAGRFASKVKALQTHFMHHINALSDEDNGESTPQPPKNS